MNTTRRSTLRRLGAMGAWAVASTAGLVKPLLALAADWNKGAFEAKTLPEALQNTGIASATDSKDIVIKAPDIAENGAVVPVEISSKIPDTRQIYIFAEKNPQPLVANFVLAAGVEGYISTRIKMGETSHIKVVVNAANKYYTASKEVKVTIGGCC